MLKILNKKTSRSVSVASAVVMAALTTPVLEAQITGQISRDVWYNIYGDQSLLNLTRSMRYYQAPHAQVTADKMQTPSGITDYYAQRLRGQIIAPETGYYTFWIAGDENCELSLSSDSSKFNKTRLAWIDGKEFLGYSAPEEWDKLSSQQSLPVYLEAGQSYFVEALQKEREHFDHLAVAWSRTGSAVMQNSAVGANVTAQWTDNDNVIDLSVEAGDIWTVDSFGFRHRSLTGDGEVIARITAMNAPWPWAKVGVMMREGLGAADRHAMMVRTGSNGMQFQSRAVTGGGATYNVYGVTMEWVRMIRKGNTFIGMVSADGENWIEISRRTIAMNATLEVGIAATDNAATVPVIATIENFGITSVAGREIVPGAHLQTYTLDSNDLDDDDLPDDWEVQHGLSSSDNGSTVLSNGPLGDPDNDGFLNIDEYRNGTDPQVNGGIPGYLSMQSWYNVGGYKITDLTFDDRFHQAPDAEEFLGGAVFDEQVRDQYGARFRGFVTAPVSGDYTFWIAGDNHVELSLSTDTSKFNKQRIAWHDGLTLVDEWDKYTTQQSATVTLVAGEKYYIETLLKEEFAAERMAIAWQVPGGQREVIPASALESYAKAVDDPDDDGLPTSWENAYGFDPLSASGSGGALGDPDGDLIANWLEYQNGTDPTVANTLDGALTHELWFGIAGAKVDDLRESGKLTQQPDIRNLLFEAEGPISTYNNYGNRIRGYILAPVTGSYRFWASGDDQVEFWLSTDEDKFNRQLLLKPGIRTGHREWDRDISQKSGLVDLVAGQRYYIEVLHKDSLDRDSVSIAWERPGEARELISSAYLRSYLPQATDLDDDDLPDAWEVANGLDANDNGSGNSVNGHRGDLDGDGLLNYEEYEAGTRADLADTDGDGVSDYDEVRLLETEALAGDVAPFQSVQVINGSAFSAQLGSWSTNGNLGYSSGVRGWVEYQVNVPSDGLYLLDLTMGPRTGGALSDDYEVIFSVDGHRLGRVALDVAEGATGQAKILSPWLSAGTHTVRIFNDNALTFRRVNFHTLEVLSAQGTDADTNGTPDWVDSRMAANNGFDNAASGSKVSPFCLEGRATYPGMISLQGSTPAVTINATAGNRWYADVPLSATADTTVDFNFENGGLAQQHDIAWLMTNMLEENTITLRQGDSLRLTAFDGGSPNGSDKVWLTIDGVTHYFKGDEPMEHLFDVPGTHIIGVKHRQGNGNAASEVIHTVTVEVVAPVTIESPVCVPGHLREWDIPALPAGAILELDDRLIVRETIAMAGGVTRYLVETTAPDTLRAQVRLGANGPVLNSLTVRALTVRNSDNTSMQFIQDFGDGSYQVDMPTVVSEVHADIRINYDIFIAGVIFDTGGISKDHFAVDFDALGQSMVTFIKTGTNGSACHRTSVWQGDKRIAFFF